MPILILSSSLRVHRPSRFFPSGFHIKSTYAFFPFLSLLDLDTSILLHLMTMGNHEPVHYAVFSKSCNSKRVPQLVEQLNRFFPFNM
jgi:hypothetical protein